MLPVSVARGIIGSYQTTQKLKTPATNENIGECRLQAQNKRLMPKVLSNIKFWKIKTKGRPSE